MKEIIQTILFYILIVGSTYGFMTFLKQIVEVFSLNNFDWFHKKKKLNKRQINDLEKYLYREIEIRKRNAYIGKLVGNKNWKNFRYDHETKEFKWR